MKLRVLVIVFAVIVLVLLGVLFFYNPVKGPTVPQPMPNIPATSTSVSTTVPIGQ